MRSSKISASQPRVGSQLEIEDMKSINRRNEWSIFAARPLDGLLATTSRIPGRRASTVSAAAVKTGRVHAEHNWDSAND